MKNVEKITNTVILEFINQIGIELADHNHKWSQDLREKYEKITKYLSSY
jgi:hypothetical protein